MAEYVKLTGIAAKMGVAIACLAVVAGVAENAFGRGPNVTVMPVAATREPKARAPRVLKGPSVLKLKVKGLTTELKTDLRKLESEANIFYFFEHSAGKHFLTITGANANFLTVSDANLKFLPLGGTAQNSNELGGLPPSAFVQGDGGLVSGAATLSASAQQTLLSTPGIEVDVATNGNGFPSVTIDNSTGLLLPAVQEQGGTDTGITLHPGPNSLTLVLQNGVDQLHLQTFRAGSFNRVLTLTISINFSAAEGSSSFAGQVINGGI